MLLKILIPINISYKLYGMGYFFYYINSHILFAPNRYIKIDTYYTIVYIALLLKPMLCR